MRISLSGVKEVSTGSRMKAALRASKAALALSDQ
tara:strand:- start:1644 stop:1745 length:102 start_codon:yes stop_codon:yes gene_type:complete